MYRPSPREDLPAPRVPERRSSVRHDASDGSARQRVVLRDPDSPNLDGTPGEAVGESDGRSITTSASLSVQRNGRLTGVYENYLLVRPYPSLRILFTSPSMRVPGILQTPLLDRVGGSSRIRKQFVRALDAGDDTDTLGELEPVGRSRWLHCTPLTGSNGKVGVWMVVIVDDESEPLSDRRRYGDRHGDGHRPGTDMSEASEDDEPIHGFMSQGQQRPVRPRKSSETLGIPANITSKDHDASEERPQPVSSPRRRGRSTSSSPARQSPFYDASTGIFTRHSPFPPPFGSEKGRVAREKLDDGRVETPMPAWPMPPHVSAPRKKREQQVFVPPAIPETASERAPSRGREDGETSSTRSRFSNRSKGSAYTVRIEEGD